MSGTAIDFSKYEQAAPPGTGHINFSKYETQDSADATGGRSTGQPNGVLDTLGREGKSLGESLAGIPGGIYHAFADEPTPEETQEAGGPQEVSGAKRIGLGIGRLTAAPVIHAAEWYKDAAQGKIPDPVGQALGVAPEAMGAGGAGVIAGKLAESAPRGLSAIRDADLGSDIKAKGVALGKVAGQDALSHIPIAGRLVRRPSLGDYLDAARTKAPEPEPLFSKTRLGPDNPPPEITRARGLGGYRARGAEALGTIPTPETTPEPPPVRLGPEKPPDSVIKARGLGGYVSADPAAGLGQIPIAHEAPDVISSSIAAPGRVSSALRIPQAPVTENPVVGSLVRAMQKSGLPISERPNLLLKGSGRVNRILEPDEELTGPLENSLEQARKQREQ